MENGKWADGVYCNTSMDFTNTLNLVRHDEINKFQEYNFTIRIIDPNST